MNTDRLTISTRFRGPKDSGNGGYTAGRIAQIAGITPARITLLAPPPLEQEIVVEESDRGIVARLEDGTVVAACKQGEIAGVVPEIPSLEEARQARANFIMEDYHVFPECFTCGTGRSDDGGLCIHPGLLPDTETVAAVWTPDDSLPSADGVLQPEILWAALDCPGAFACMRGKVRPLVLGRMCAEIREPVRAGEDIIVLGWPILTTGRKEQVGSALVSADGRVLAVAESLWIAISEDHADFAVAKSS